VDQLIERCAGLDVHKASVTACVRVPGEDGTRQQQTRTFRTTTAGLVLLRDWLASYQVTVVGMESTGVYWKPCSWLLEDDFACWLLNARHLRNVPGRKTDVKDAQWICQLVEHGLVRPSFVPPKPIRELRDLTRYRKALVQERTREAQRLHTLLEDAGIKLSSVASDT
jgi:transposase